MGSIAAFAGPEGSGRLGDDIIGMDDMMAIYEVTDLFGIDRETISVPLDKEGAGAVSAQPGGALEVTAPAEVGTREWLPTLRETLLGLGYQEVEGEIEWDC